MMQEANIPRRNAAGVPPEMRLCQGTDGETMLHPRDGELLGEPGHAAATWYMTNMEGDWVTAEVCDDCRAKMRECCQTYMSRHDRGGGVT